MQILRPQISFLKLNGWHYFVRLGLLVIIYPFWLLSRIFFRIFFVTIYIFLIILWPFLVLLILIFLIYSIVALLLHTFIKAQSYTHMHFMRMQLFVDAIAASFCLVYWLRKCDIWYWRSSLPLSWIVSRSIVRLIWRCHHHTLNVAVVKYFVTVARWHTLLTTAWIVIMDIGILWLILVTCFTPLVKILDLYGWYFHHANRLLMGHLRAVHFVFFIGLVVTLT